MIQVMSTKVRSEANYCRADDMPELIPTNGNVSVRLFKKGYEQEARLATESGRYRGIAQEEKSPAG